MKLYIALFVVTLCDVVLSTREAVAVCSEKLADDIINEIKENNGENANNYFLAAKKLDEFSNLTELIETGVSENGNPAAVGTMKWEKDSMEFPGSIIFKSKWVKLLHGAKDVGGEVMKGAATRIAAKAAAISAAKAG